MFVKSTSRGGVSPCFLADSSDSARGGEGMKEFLGALSFIFDSFVSFASLHRDKADKGNLFREGGKLLLVDVLFFPLLLLLLSLFRR